MSTDPDDSFWRHEALRLGAIVAEVHQWRFDPWFPIGKMWERHAELMPGPPPAKTIEGALGQLIEALGEEPAVRMEIDLAEALGLPPGAHEHEEMCSMVESQLAAAMARAEAAESALGAQQRLNLSFVEQNNTLIRRNLALGDTENGPLARAEAAELENRAWRALAEWEREPETYRAVAWEYDPAPLVSASGDAGAYETAREPTVQAAAMALATKLGLINPEPGAKGDGG